MTVELVLRCISTPVVELCYFLTLHVSQMPLHLLLKLALHKIKVNGTIHSNNDTFYLFDFCPKNDIQQKVQNAVTNCERDLGRKEEA